MTPIPLFIDCAQQALPSIECLREMLRRMLRIRLFEECASKLMKESHIVGFLHNSIGQEAEIVGSCMALNDDDYMTGNHRSHGHPIGKGVSLAPLMAELLGREEGVCCGKGGSMHLAAFAAGSLGESGIVGSLMPVAVGAGLSARLRGTRQVCVCFFGDGAANCGPFHESLNLAAIWQLPVIFLCENNGYAIRSAQRQTTAVKDIAARAAAYEMPGVIVDGQDVLSVYDAVCRAVSRAREGAGPTLIEAKTYRYCEHLESPGEAPVFHYRSKAEVDVWRRRDPIELFIGALRARELLTEQEIRGVRLTTEAEVAAAAEFALSSRRPAPQALFEGVFTRPVHKEAASDGTSQLP